MRVQTLEEFNLVSSSYAQSLGDSFRKKNGVFFTDVKLAKLIVDYLKIDRTKTVLDPCCGTGSFLYAILKSGHSVNCLYGADVDKHTALCCEAIIDFKPVIIDTLFNLSEATINKLQLNDKVDYVIGNPPYRSVKKHEIIAKADIATNANVFLRKDFGDNLFCFALWRSFDLVKADGIVSYIIPKNFLHVKKYSFLRKYILNHKSIMSIIDLGACFQDVRGEQILLTFKNCYTDANRFEVLKYIDGSFQHCCFVEQSLCTDEILLFKNEIDQQLYVKLEKFTKLSDLSFSFLGRGNSKDKNAISGKDIRKFGFKDFSVPVHGDRIFIQNIYSTESGIIATFAGSELQARQTVTILINDDEDVNRYIVGLLHSRFCNFYLLRFCYNNAKLTLHTDTTYLSKIPLVTGNQYLFNKVVSIVKAIEDTDYLSKEWFDLVEELNKFIYDIYDIKFSEREYIDEEIKVIQSKKWVRSNV